MPRDEDLASVPSGYGRQRDWIRWIGALTALTAAMVAVRPSLDSAHIALLYLLVVLGASSAAGRALGFAVSVAAFLLFNFFFVPPFGTLTVAHPLDLLVLATFLVTSIITAQLLSRANREADEARARAREIDRMASLGVETLNAVDARDALNAIVGVIQSVLHVEYCEVVNEPLPDTAATARDDECEFLLPLRVRDEVVGALRLKDSRGLNLTPARRRLLDALAYYAALGVERARLTEAAEQSERQRRLESMRSALLMSVSHDLRTPLTSIKGIAREIADGGDPRAAEDIELAADRLNALIGDMLELSRIQAGAARATPAVETIDDLVGAGLRQSRSVLKDRAVLIDGTEELLSGRFVFTDALRILVNLLENAAKYSPVGKPIDLRIRRTGSMITLEIMDRGPGVSEPERERIFDPFYRGPRSPADPGGTGLGLSIARGLAEAQGGRVRYEPRDGGGSIFALELPAEESPELPATANDG
jgi:two-component system sensor histidine kinase KdpD